MFQFPANPALGQQFAPVQGVTYEWNGTGWIFLGLNTASLYPPGIVLPYAGGAPLPFQGWLICDGANYARTAYPALFGIIGTAYGSTNATDFRVPDLRGRVIAGPDSSALMGAAGRLTSVGSGVGAAGGEEWTTLNTAHIPSHNHGIGDVAHSHGVNDPSHAHGVYDPGHSHSLNDPTHNHGINDAGHAHGYHDPGHTHPYQYSTNQEGGDNYAGQGGGPSRIYSQQSNVGGAATGIVIAGSGANIGIYGAYTGLSVNGAGTSIGIYGAGTGISIQGSGSGLSATYHAGGSVAHGNVQPVIILNYIIRA